MKITISRAAFIAAASVVQASQDIRYYLNGILIEKGPDNHPIIVATDGHRLIAAIDDNGLCSDDMPESVIIDFGLETLRAAKLAKNLDSPLQIDVQSPLDVHTTIGEITTNGSKTIDGTYPDWRRIAKDTAGKSAGWFNASYVADFERVARFLNPERNKTLTSITLRSDDGNTSAAVYFGNAPYAFGILMPMRADIENPCLPGWAAGPFKKAA